LSFSAGRYAATTFGDLPQDLVGLLGDGSNTSGVEGGKSLTLKPTESFMSEA
jgi:hypothetical protein